MISPSLATVNVALVAAFVGLAARPETPYIFATMSNLAYTFAAFYSELASANRGRLLGSLSESTLFLVIIGASSFGFHTRLRLGTPLHTLDIWGGWLLVAHAAYITISVLVIALTRVCLPTRHEETGTRVVRLGLSLSFMTGLTLITVYYDTIYANQMQFYFTIGGFAATAGLLARFVVTFKENGACSFRAAMIALFEIAILLTALASAVYSQGELIGRRLPNQKEEYDLFHGNWHYLLASTFSVIYTRAEFIERYFLGEGNSCVCNMPLVDVVGEVLLGAYAVCSLVCKEAEINVATAKITLGCIVGLMGVHALATVYVVLKKRRLGGDARSRSTPVLAPARVRVQPLPQRRYKQLDPIEAAALRFNV